MRLLSHGGLFIEIRQGSIRLLQGDETLELPLERQTNGRLNADSSEKIAAALQAFLKKRKWQSRLRAVCAIDARGVSLRHLKLPADARQEFNNVLRLQIESEFPLPPQELAWGCIDSNEGSQGSGNGSQELTVVAVKRDVLQDYTELFARCGVNPVFTLAALARSWVVDRGPQSFAVLDIGRRQSELMMFEGGKASGLRILNWGGENITREIEQRLGITHDEAEKLKLQWDDGPQTNGEVGKAVNAAISRALDDMAAAINETWSGAKLYVTGRATGYKDLPKQLAAKLRGATQCERIEPVSGSGKSPAAIAGLQACARVNGGSPPLVFRVADAKTGDAEVFGESRSILAWLSQAKGLMSRPPTAEWARLAIVLAILAISFPLLEPLVMKPFFVRKLASIKADRGRLGLIDRELNFLQFLKQTQPPYIDTLTVLACSVGPGSRFDSISMNRQGDLALKGSLKDSTQVTEFRSKLIKSGYFSNVTVEEQTPTPDRQKLNVRITAQLKPAAARAAVSVDTILSNAPPVSPGGGGFGGAEMMFPGGMPMPGMPPPGPMPAPRPARPTNASPTKMEKSAPPKTTIKVGDQTIEVSPGSGPIQVLPQQP